MLLALSFPVLRRLYPEELHLRFGDLGLEGDDDVCFAVRHDDISSRWVIAAKFLVVRACIRNIALAVFLVRLVDDGKIVAVEMNLAISEWLQALRRLTTEMNDLRDGRQHWRRTPANVGRVRDGPAVGVDQCSGVTVMGALTSGVGIARRP